MRSVEWAESYAQDLLSPLGARWTHSKEVARKAGELAEPLRLRDREVLVAAAYLHDIGYAPALAFVGFHPVDGGRHLRDLGDARLAGLVAHHGGAVEEALLRDLSEALGEFRPEDSDVARVLDYCDLTVGPNGEEMTPQQRFADVESRYGPEHVVTEALRLAWPRLTKVFDRVATMLAAGGQPR